MRDLFHYESQLANKDSTMRLIAEVGDSESKRELLLVAPMVEDIVMSIGNKFSDDGGGFLTNMAESAYDSIRKSAPFMSESLNTITNSALTPDSFKPLLNSVGGMVSKGANKALKTYADRIRYFQGTEISFDIPFRAVVYHNSYFDSAGNPLTVKQVLVKLVNRVVGDVEGIGGDGSGLSRFFAFQKAPNGYTAQLSVLSDEVRDLPPGTFTVEVGNLYSIKGLLIEHVGVVLSKQKVKHAPGTKPNSAEGDILYAEITVTVTPAMDYLKGNIKNFLNLPDV